MTLYVGYKASDIKPEMLDAGAVFHTLDIYHRHAIEKVHHAKAICSPHLPEGPWDRVVFRTGPKLMSGELELDLLQEAVKLRIGEAESLPLQNRDVKISLFSGGRDSSAPVRPGLYLDYVGRERDRNDLIDRIKDRTDRTFKAEWPASVPGGGRLMFTSYPGCFCHRRLDEGGLALAEVVVKELKAKVEVEERNSTILDMGCGCGLVGFLIADSLRGATNPEPRTPNHEPRATNHVSLTLVDSHSRAVEAAKENAEKFGLPAEVILSDNGTPARMDGTFDVFVGNPPYYSDYRIADVFLETAKRALKSGGVCYTVCKNAAGLEPVQKKYFPEVEIVRRRGYAVLKSIKP